jgi:hypothetical protein
MMEHGGQEDVGHRRVAGGGTFHLSVAYVIIRFFRSNIPKNLYLTPSIANDA